MEAAILQLAHHCLTGLLDAVCQDEKGEYGELLSCYSKSAAIKSARLAFTTLDVNYETEN